MQFVKKENRTDASYLRGHECFEMLSYATKWIKTHNQLRSQIEVCEQKTYIHTQCRSAEIFFFFFSPAGVWQLIVWKRRPSSTETKINNYFKQLCSVLHQYLVWSICGCQPSFDLVLYVKLNIAVLWGQQTFKGLHASLCCTVYRHTQV